MSQAIVFKNFSDEPFTWKWDGTSYSFAPGQSMMMEDWKAQHFAKHLVDREILKMDRNAMHLQDPRRTALLARALPNEETIETQDDSQLQTALLNQKFVCPECEFSAKSSAGLSVHIRKKHEVTEKETTEENSTEEVFEDVK